MEMADRPFKDAVASVRPELEALSRSDGAEPADADENVRMSAWVALCLAALAEVSEEAGVNDDDEMAGAADTREAMLGAGRIALDALEQACGIERARPRSRCSRIASPPVVSSTRSIAASRPRRTWSSRPHARRRSTSSPSRRRPHRRCLTLSFDPQRHLLAHVVAIAQDAGFGGRADARGRAWDGSGAARAGPAHHAWLGMLHQL
jgi:hypothetical protein